MSLAEGMDLSLSTLLSSSSSSSPPPPLAGEEESTTTTTKQEKEGRVLSPTEKRLFAWHRANLEYANASDLSKNSLMHWDQVK